MRPVVCSGCSTVIRDRYEWFELRHEIRKVSDLSRFSTHKVADLCRECAQKRRPIDTLKNPQTEQLFG